MKKEATDIIYGIRAIQEAIESGKDIDKLLIRQGLKGELSQQLFAVARKKGIPFQYVPVEKLDKITRDSHQGVIAYISPIAFHNTEKVLTDLLDQKKIPLFLILDRVTDMRNFGAIARSAECAGVDALIIADKNTARIGGDAIKTSAGALHTVKVCREKNLVDVVMLLQQSDVKVVAATEKGKNLYTETDMTTPLAVIVGSEDRGIEPRLLRMADDLVKIPMLGKIASLNVSVAASLMVYEAVRQRR